MRILVDVTCNEKDQVPSGILYREGQKVLVLFLQNGKLRNSTSPAKFSGKRFFEACKKCTRTFWPSRYLLFCLSVDQRIMATIRLPSDTLLTVLSYLSWTDISKFATNILFGSFQSILCSDSLLLLLNQRDLYCPSLQTLPPLSIPMQIYIYSQIIL